MPHMLAQVGTERSVLTPALVPMHPLATRNAPYRLNPDESETAMKVDVVLDIACAWSALGYTRFQKAAARFRSTGGTLRVDFHPFQHVHGLGPSTALRMERMSRLAAQDGLTLNFDTRVPADTFEAHRLISLAAAHDRAEAMAARLFRAHFTEGRDVGDHAVLKALAREVGVPWNRHAHAGETRDDLDFARRFGVAVPVFHFADGTTYTGAHPVDDLLEALHNALRVTV